jgi:hypothetical protein
VSVLAQSFFICLWCGRNNRLVAFVYLKSKNRDFVFFEWVKRLIFAQILIKDYERIEATA